CADETANHRQTLLPPRFRPDPPALVLAAITGRHRGLAVGTDRCPREPGHPPQPGTDLPGTGTGRSRPPASGSAAHHCPADAGNAVSVDPRPGHQPGPPPARAA